MAAVEVVEVEEAEDVEDIEAEEESAVEEVVVQEEVERSRRMRRISSRRRRTRGVACALDGRTDSSHPRPPLDPEASPIHPTLAIPSRGTDGGCGTADLAAVDQSLSPNFSVSSADDSCTAAVGGARGRRGGWRARRVARRREARTPVARGNGRGDARGACSVARGGRPRRREGAPQRQGRRGRRRPPIRSERRPLSAKQRRCTTARRDDRGGEIASRGSLVRRHTRVGPRSGAARRHGVRRRALRGWTRVVTVAACIAYWGLGRCSRYVYDTNTSV